MTKYPSKEKTYTPPPPPVFLRMFLTWFCVFALATLGTYLVTPFAADWSIPARTFVVTIVVVPVTFYVGVPVLLSIRSWSLKLMHRMFKRAN